MEQVKSDLSGNFYGIPIFPDFKKTWQITGCFSVGCWFFYFWRRPTVGDHWRRTLRCPLRPFWVFSGSGWRRSGWIGVYPLGAGDRRPDQVTGWRTSMFFTSSDGYSLFNPVLYHHMFAQNCHYKGYPGFTISIFQWLSPFVLLVYPAFITMCYDFSTYCGWKKCCTSW